MEAETLSGVLIVKNRVNFKWRVLLKAKIKKIAVVGNAGAGKTTLSRRLAMVHKLPLTHVDSIQFLAGMKIRPYRESIEILKKIELQEEWIIDGYGPLDLIEKRFQLSDKIVFIDFPLWRHYWWSLKRQFINIFCKRAELPEGCNELSLQYLLKLFKTIKKVHYQMRPELLRIFSREIYKDKIIFIRSLRDFRQLARDGIAESK